MKVLINLLQCHREYTGTGRYIRNICRELAKIAPRDQFVQLVAMDNAETYRIGSDNFSQIRVPLRITRRTQRILFEQAFGPWLWQRFRGLDNVLWSPNDVPIIGWPGRQVVTIHDLRRLHLPQYFGTTERLYYRAMMQLAALRSTRILTVSEFSKRDIHEQYNVPLDRIHVAYNAVDPELKRELNELRIEGVLSRFGLRKPFILFVGQQLEIKGPHTLVEAFARVVVARPELQLALVGKPGNATALIDSIAEHHGLGESLRRIPWVSDEDLRCLYSAATAMAFPSRYEGFGIPIIEAMQCGTPVITTRHSCLPEVAGEAAYFVHDDEVSTLAETLNKVLSDQTQQRDMISRGFKNAARFSWQTSASQVLDALTAATR